MTLQEEIVKQIDAAFDYRGHVTVSFEDGTTIVGYLFNRELSPMNGDAYIEIIPKDTDERRRFPASEVKSVAITGKDFAAPFVPQKKD